MRLIFFILGAMNIGTYGNSLSAVAWAKRKDALCFQSFVAELISTLVLWLCVKATRKGERKCNTILQRALLELYQDMLLKVPTDEFNDMESYRKL